MSASVTGGELIDRDTAIVRGSDITAVRLLDPMTFTLGGTREEDKGKNRRKKSKVKNFLRRRENNRQC